LQQRSACPAAELRAVGRYRAPQPTGSKYITPEGAKRLREELDHLWRVQRPQVTASVAAAAAQGDRSENAEYIYGKRQLREIDRRVRFLRKRLEGIVVVDYPPSDPRRVFFGAWVRVEDDNGTERCVRIVGPDEFDLAADYISMDSPLARALMRKTVDDEISVELPGGARSFVVLEITYGSRPVK
jgi:transcription elongation factor GreB